MTGNVCSGSKGEILSPSTCFPLHPPTTDMRQLPRNDRFVPQPEIAPSHSITSSARARIDGGKVMPSAFAVFRLMTRKNFVGW